MAGARIRGITIEIGGDTSNLVKALKNADTAIRTTQSDLNRINSALKFDTTNISLLRDKQIALNDKVAEAKEKLQAEKDMMEQLKNSDGFDKNSAEAKRLQAEIDADTVALKKAQDELNKFGNVGAQVMQGVGAKLQEVGSKIKSFGDGVKDIGSKLTTSVTVPIVAGFTASVKSAIDWESAFTGVMKTVDESANTTYEDLKKSINEIAQTTASSQNDIAATMEIAGQLGIAADDIAGFTKTMIELGDTTNLSSEEAATALARFMNITGESTANVDKIGSAIVDLGNNFATSESEIVEMSTRLASAGTIAGLSSTDILALSAAMSSVGIQAEAGGTAMTQTLAAMTSAVADFEAGSVDDLEAIANISGMTAEEFAKSWNEKPIEAVQSFISGLGQLDEKGENATLVLDELGMSGVRQSNMLQSLALASDVLTEAIDKSSDAYTNNSALEEEAAKRYETMEAKISQLKARFTEIAVQIGEMLMPYVEKLMDVIQGLIDKWNGLDSSQQQMIVKIAAIVAAVGPVLTVIGSVISAIGTVVSIIGTVSSAIGTIMAVLSGPIGIIAAIVAAVVALGVAIYKNWDDIVAWATGVATTIQEFAAGVIEKILLLKDDLLAKWEEIKTNILNKVTEIKTNAVQGFENLKTAVGTAITNLKTNLSTLWENIKTFISNTVTNIKTNVTQAFDNIKQNIVDRITGAKEAIINGLQEAANFVSELPGKFLQWGKEMIENLISGIKEKISGVTEAISGVAETIASFIHFSVPDKGALHDFNSFMPDMMRQLASGIENGIPMIENAMDNMTRSMVPKIELSGSDAGSTTNNNNNSVNITVYGAQGQDVNELADIIQDKINSQVYTKGAVFA